MNYKEQTAALNAIPIRDVASWVGKELPETGSALCPFPDHPEKNKSFEVKRGGVRWQCYSCNRSGGSIDFVAAFFGYDFITAKKWLISNSAAPIKHHPVRQALPTTSKDRKSSATEICDFEVYEKFVELCPLSQGGIDYLTSRSLSKATLARFRIGQVGVASDVAKQITKQFGFDRAKTAGLLSSKSTPGNIRLSMPDHAIVFPFLEKGRVMYCQGRAIGKIAEWRKWFNLPGRARRTFNIDALDSNDPVVAICEGVSDTISAEELGYNSIGILGVTDYLAARYVEKMRERDVLILLDWDIPGELRARALESELSRFGVMATRKRQPYPGLKDVNQYLMHERGMI